jgi:hypothetical protein
MLRQQTHDLAAKTFLPRSGDDSALLLTEVRETIEGLAARGVATSGVLTFDATNLAIAHCANQYELATQAVIRACKSQGFRPAIESAVASVKMFGDPGCARIEADVAQALRIAPNPAGATANLQAEITQAGMRGLNHARAEIEHFMVDVDRGARVVAGSHCRSPRRRGRRGIGRALSGRGILDLRCSSSLKSSATRRLHHGVGPVFSAGRGLTAKAAQRERAKAVHPYYRRTNARHQRRRHRAT